jgi:hypothetical protein
MLTLIGAAALGLLFIVVAPAHGVEQWIADQQLSDPVLRTYCCGPSDCQQLSDGAVIETEGGYLVRASGAGPRICRSQAGAAVRAGRPLSCLLPLRRCPTQYRALLDRSAAIVVTCGVRCHIYGASLSRHRLAQ